MAAHTPPTQQHTTRPWRQYANPGIPAVLVLVAGLLGYLGYSSGSHWLVAGGGACVGLSLSPYLHRTPGHLSCTITGPEQVHVGQTLHQNITFTNEGTAILDQVVCLVQQKGLSDVEMRITELKPQLSVTIPLARTALTRGSYRQANLEITTGSELKFTGYSTQLLVSAPVTVRPALLSPKPLPVTDTIEPDTHLHGIREFRHGDTPRTVHWRSTARHGRLIVTERFAPEPAPTVVALIGQPTSDAGEVRLAQAAADAVQLQTRYPVRVVAWDTDGMRVAPTGPAALYDWCARLTGLTVPNPAQLALAAQNSGALVIAQLTDVPPPTSAPLVSGQHLAVQ